jgi:hypothetical protein
LVSREITRNAKDVGVVEFANQAIFRTINSFPDSKMLEITKKIQLGKKVLLESKTNFSFAALERLEAAEVSFVKGLDEF